MQRVCKENEWGKVSKRIVTVPSIRVASQSGLLSTCSILLPQLLDPQGVNRYIGTNKRYVYSLE